MDEFARRRVVLDLPGARDVSVNKDLVYKSVAGLELKADVYAPTEAEPKELRPGVILVHGDGRPDLLASAKEWGQYESWGRLVAASGLVGIAFNHRSSEGRTRLPEAAGDVEDLLEWVQENHREIGVTPTRLCLWTCSAGPPVAFREVLGGGVPSTWSMMTTGAETSSPGRSSS